MAYCSEYQNWQSKLKFKKKCRCELGTLSSVKFNAIYGQEI